MDIIDRLKKHAEDADAVGADCAAICEPAWREIERLRNALRLFERPLQPPTGNEEESA